MSGGEEPAAVTGEDPDSTVIRSFSDAFVATRAGDGPLEILRPAPPPDPHVIRRFGDPDDDDCEDGDPLEPLRCEADTSDGGVCQAALVTDAGRRLVEGDEVDDGVCPNAQHHSPSWAS